MTYPERTGKRPIANRPRVTNPPHMGQIGNGSLPANLAITTVMSSC